VPVNQPEMDPRKMSRLVKQTEVGEASPEAEGEGGEGFYIAQRGRRLDLLVNPGGRNSERGESPLPVLFWRVSVAAPDFARAG
jgi:hypothetical protein